MNIRDLSIKDASEMAKLLAYRHKQERAKYQSLNKIFEDDQEVSITPLEEFWGHCSNLQVWVENEYNTRLLHSNIAFSLLKRLGEIGDPIANKVFKEEIIHRIEEGNVNVITYLFEEGYFSYFSKQHILKKRQLAQIPVLLTKPGT